MRLIILLLYIHYVDEANVLELNELKFSVGEVEIQKRRGRKSNPTTKLNYCVLKEGDYIKMSPTAIITQTHVGVFVCVMVSSEVSFELDNNGEDGVFIAYTIPETVENDLTLAPFIITKVSKKCHSNLHLVPIQFFIKSIKKYDIRDDASKIMLID